MLLSSCGRKPTATDIIEVNLYLQVDTYFEVKGENPLENDVDGGPGFWLFVENYKGKIFAIPPD